MHFDAGLAAQRLILTFRAVAGQGIRGHKSNPFDGSVLVEESRLDPGLINFACVRRRSMAKLAQGRGDGI